MWKKIDAGFLWLIDKIYFLVEWVVVISVMPIAVIVYNALIAESSWINKHGRPQWVFWVMYMSLTMALVTIVNIIYLSFG